MGAPLKWTLIITSLLLLGSRRQTRPISRPLNSTLEASALSPRLQQSDEQFGYEVISRAFDRTADANRFLDTLLFALIAAQSAIYAIILDKLKEYPALGWELLLGGLTVAILGATLTLLVRDGPDPERFAAIFPDDPPGTRRLFVDTYVVDAKRNDQLRTAKLFALAISLGLTIGPLIIATVGRAHGV